MHYCNAIGLFLLVTTVSSFAPSSTPVRLSHHGSPILVRSTASDESDSSRRGIFQKAALLGISSLFPASPAHAAKKESEPLTKENVEAAFAALKYELQDPNGGVSIMQQRIDERDFVGLLDFTKNYDQVLRKGKWARAKAFLTNNAEKEVATLQGNAITFDLIGINRACRVGQENADLANKYLNELRTDLQKMIDMESKINFDQDGFEAYMDAVRS